MLNLESSASNAENTSAAPAEELPIAMKQGPVSEGTDPSTEFDDHDNGAVQPAAETSASKEGETSAVNPTPPTEEIAEPTGESTPSVPAEEHTKSEKAEENTMK